MRGAFKKAWLSFLIQGAFNLVSGVLLVLMKEPTIISIAEILGVFSLATGIVLISGALSGRRDDEHWWFLLQSGSLQVVLAILFFAPLYDRGIRLVLLMGVCAIVTGVSSVVASLRLRQERMNGISLLLVGIISLLFGCWVVFSPGEGLLDRRWHVAIYLALSGIATLYFSYRLWDQGREMNTPIRSLGPRIKRREL